jgi:LysR family transcriptional regulator, hydrogen peroxide-inducible genes activator
MPSLRQLQYLVALSDCRHYRRAAERVGVTQPTLSAQLTALEERLGIPLVERGRAQVVLTSAGEQVLSIARKIVAAIKDIEDIAASHRKEMSGVIRLGLPPTIGPHLLPPVVTAMREIYPDLRLYIRENLPDALPDALAQGVHDLLILPLPVRGDDVETSPLFREPLFFAVPSSHRLAAQQEIQPDDLAGEPVLTLEQGHALHHQVQALCQEFQARLLYDYEGTSLATLHQMVEMGFGTTFLPGLYVRSAVEPGRGIRLLAIKGRHLQRTIGLAWRRASPQEKTFRKFGGLICGVVKRQFPDFPVLGETAGPQAR